MVIQGLAHKMLILLLGGGASDNFHPPEFLQSELHAFQGVNCRVGKAGRADCEYWLPLFATSSSLHPQLLPRLLPPSPLGVHHLLVSSQVIYNQQSWRTGLISDIVIPSVLQK